MTESEAASTPLNDEIEIKDGLSKSLDEGEIDSSFTNEEKQPDLVEIKEKEEKMESRNGHHGSIEKQAASPIAETPIAYRRHSSKKSVSRSPSRSRSHHSKKKKHKHHKRSHSRSHSRSRSRSHSRDYRRSHKKRTRSRSRSHSYDDHHRYSQVPTYTSGRRQYGIPPVTSPGKCLGVFGMSVYTGETTLRSFFSRYGPIASIQIVYDRITGRSRGFGFIYFDHLEDAIRAKEGAVGQDIDGQRVRIDYSVTQGPRPSYRDRNGHYGDDYRRRSRSGSYNSRYY